MLHLGGSGGYCEHGHRNITIEASFAGAALGPGLAGGGPRKGAYGRIGIAVVCGEIPERRV